MNTREQTRVREQGTIVTNPADGLQRINAVRQIVTDSQYAKIDGIMLDLFSASAILKVYDNINEANKVKYSSMPVYRMAEIAFKIMNK
jgi:hypothetical protein